MILWIFKLISSVRRAIAGRKHPHQLAWAVAFGLLLGVIPHGNLLALAVLLLVLSLKINHAMAALTAVATTFLASLLDVHSDRVGHYVLTHPELRETAATIWQLPLVPWTDLNNTVVLGSFLIGVASLLPTFALTYPVFRLLSARETELPESPPTRSLNKEERSKPSERRTESAVPHQVIMIDREHTVIAQPHRRAPSEPATAQPSESSPQTEPPCDTKSKPTGDGVPLIEVAPCQASPVPCVAVETKIEVIRMKEQRGPDSTGGSEHQDPTDPPPMDEALNYLLRQLRDSQQRKAA